MNMNRKQFDELYGAEKASAEFRQFAQKVWFYLAGFPTNLRHHGNVEVKVRYAGNVKNGGEFHVRFLLKNGELWRKMWRQRKNECRFTLSRENIDALPAPSSVLSQLLVSYHLRAIEQNFFLLDEANALRASEPLWLLLKLTSGETYADVGKMHSSIAAYHFTDKKAEVYVAKKAKKDPIGH